MPSSEHITALTRREASARLRRRGRSRRACGDHSTGRLKCSPIPLLRGVGIRLTASTGTLERTGTMPAPWPDLVTRVPKEKRAALRRRFDKEGFFRLRPNYGCTPHFYSRTVEVAFGDGRRHRVCFRTSSHDLPTREMRTVVRLWDEIARTGRWAATPASGRRRSPARRTAVKVGMGPGSIWPVTSQRTAGASSTASARRWPRGSLPTRRPRSRR
jgi:hypothetical protein